MKTILLAGGSGTRLWPFNSLRNKAMIKVANKPIVRHIIEQVLSVNCDELKDFVIAAGPFHEQITNEFMLDSHVKVVSISSKGGNAFTLAEVAQMVRQETCMVLYCDVLLSKDDISSLIGVYQKHKATCVITTEVVDKEHHDYINVMVEDNKITKVIGHPIHNLGDRICGYIITSDFWKYVTSNSGIFTSVDVGMMPPKEGFLEMSIHDYISHGNTVWAVRSTNKIIDIDKPWHIMGANRQLVNEICNGLHGNSLSEGAFIDPSAAIDGYVRIGKNSVIGKNVVIKGNIVVGDNTDIVDGAIILGNAIIGDNCSIRQYCQVGGNTVIGNRCVIGHCAEFEGVCFDNVYLYHYMEIFGLVGNCVDFGAATVCGILRFDNDYTIHKVKGRREIPADYANCIYMGDYSRTGVNAILMPGVKVGVNSIVGSGVILNEDLEDGKIVYAKQELAIRDWSSDKYGW